MGASGRSRKAMRRKEYASLSASSGPRRTCAEGSLSTGYLVPEDRFLWGPPQAPPRAHIDAQRLCLTRPSVTRAGGTPGANRRALAGVVSGGPRLSSGSHTLDVGGAMSAPGA